MHTHKKKGGVGKGKSGFFEFLLPSVSSKCRQYPTPFPGASEVYFCPRLALLDVKLADKKRQLGECLLGKLNAMLTWP